MIRSFEQIGEQIQSCVLENGLRICYLPKKGFSKTFAMLATNFGSVDSSFTLDGIRTDTPAGVAHFLEHKMFEDEDGNALQKFGETGASPNAFTSNNMTAYYFSCTSGFTRNLEILLRFVYTPYFTDENLEKEKGIIGQEIGMLDDRPGWRASVGMYEGLFATHPIRISIAGSVESIAGITPAMLKQCHAAFYSPANMALVVCGNADFDEIVQLARTLSPAQAANTAVRHYGTRCETVAQAEVIQHMAVSQPQFMLGFKDIPLATGESALRRQLLGELCCRILCGETAPLYAKLYGKRLINRQFDSGYMVFPEGAVALCSGESRDPRAARAEIEAEVRRLAAEGVDEQLFARMKKAAYGMNLRVLDDPDAYCHVQANAVLRGEDYGDFAAAYDTIEGSDVQAMLTRWAADARSTLSIIEPLV